jgi:alkylation response protein AidB-like acyl-CoA dehydrogenase
MQYENTDIQKLIIQSIRDFTEKEIKPNVLEWDETQHFPKDLFQKMGAMGWMGVLVPEQYGGSGLDYHDYIKVIEEIGKVDPAIGLSVAAHNSLCTGHILQYGSEIQKQKYLPKLATGEWIGAWGLTEHNTGSDAGNMSTTALQDGDFYVLNGTKNFITHGKSAEVAVVLARTGEKGERRNATAFIIERNTPGFSAGKKENKLGMRASETTELIFDNCRIHKDQIIGEVGDGFVQALGVLDGGRISIGALSLGLAKGALEHSLRYAKEREQFGKPIASFQAIAFKLADMATEIEASELLLHKAAHLKNTNQNVTKLSAMAKMYASEVGVKAATEAIQIHGGYGYTKEFPVEKFYRDAKLNTIGEGTTEIQKLVISRQLLK